MSFIILFHPNTTALIKFGSLTKALHNCYTYTNYQLCLRRNICTRNTFIFNSKPLCSNIINFTQTCNESTSSMPPKPKKEKQRFLFSWRSFFISGTVFSIFCIGFYLFKKEKMRLLELERRRSIGKAALGGAFELIDHNGQPFSSEKLKGQWTLIYFGFTHCPDVCPDEIEKMVSAIEILEKKDEKLPLVQPVFISVDPERDTPPVVAGYIKEFSPKIIGLTGTKEQIQEASRKYRVYYSAGPKEKDDYIVDHTIIMYLVNPDGEFVDYYGQNKTAEELAHGVFLNMAKYQLMQKKGLLNWIRG